MDKENVGTKSSYEGISNGLLLVFQLVVNTTLRDSVDIIIQ
jgi:hypothetical protein